MIDGAEIPSGNALLLYKWFFSRVLKFANVHCRPGSREFIFAVKYIQLSPTLTTCLNQNITRTSAGLIGNA